MTAVRVEGGDLRLEWRGGQGPYYVQTRSRWTGRAWISTGPPLDATTALVPRSGGAGYYRVMSALFGYPGTIRSGTTERRPTRTAMMDGRRIIRTIHHA